MEKESDVYAEIEVVLESLLVGTDLENWVGVAEPGATLTLGFAPPLCGPRADIIVFDIGARETFAVTIAGIAQTFVLEDTGEDITSGINSRYLNYVAIDLAVAGRPFGPVLVEAGRHVESLTLDDAALACTRHPDPRGRRRAREFRQHDPQHDDPTGWITTMSPYASRAMSVGDRGVVRGIDVPHPMTTIRPHACPPTDSTRTK